MKKSQKFFAFLGLLGLALWFGASIAGYSIAYDLFEPGTILQLKSYLDSGTIYYFIRHFLTACFYADFGFILAFLSYIVLVPKNFKNFKTNGWMFITFILLTIAFIFQFVILFHDARLAWYIFFGPDFSFNSYEVQSFFYKRLKNLSFMFVFNILIMITIYFMLVFKPLVKKDETERT